MEFHSGIDLHLHTVVSDGTDTPAELLRQVRRAGIGLFAVTDHDAVKGALQLRGMLGANDPHFLPGVEFSCRDELGKYHILGYGYDPESAPINEVVACGSRRGSIFCGRNSAFRSRRRKSTASSRSPIPASRTSAI